MAILDKAAILAARDLKRETVEVLEWGEGATVIISELSAMDRIKFGQCMQDEKYGDKPYHALALTWFIIGEDGVRIFTEEDADALASKSPEVLKRLYVVAEQLNKFGVSVDDTAKN